MRATCTFKSSESFLKGDTISVGPIVYTVTKKMKLRKRAEDIRNFFRPYGINVRWYGVPGGLKIEMSAF